MPQNHQIGQLDFSGVMALQQSNIQDQFNNMAGLLQTLLVSSGGRGEAEFVTLPTLLVGGGVYQSLPHLKLATLGSRNPCSPVFFSTFPTFFYFFSLLTYPSPQV